MRILFLAPQPFFQERGTPIAVRLALKVLSERKTDSIELLTFSEGQDVYLENVKINRIWSPSFLHGVRPGFSVKKLICDCIFFITALSLIIKSKLNGNRFALIHAVEESVFMALILKFIFRIPYIYDMDSSLAMQLIEKLPWLKFLNPFFEWLEASAIRFSLAVIPVCDALAVIAQNKLATHVQVLPDISLSSETQSNDGEKQNLSEMQDPELRKEIPVPDDASIILYVGNLEYYQGVELLIDSYSNTLNSSDNKLYNNWHLVIIGGSKELIQSNLKKIKDLGLQDKIHLLGPRPVSMLSAYLKQASILASPRIMGNNTPMKIYSYMHSGVAIIATDLPTHRQALSPEMASLVPPNIEGFSKGLEALMLDDQLRARLAKNAFEVAEQKYTFPVFRKTLLGIYEQVEKRL